METEEFCQKAQQLRDKVADFKNKVDQEEYTPLAEEFIKSNCPYEEGKVYELVKNGVKRRGFTRFVIYIIDVHNLTFEGKIEQSMIRCGVWWLNDSNFPTKWDTMVVYGVGNNAEFVLSQNQNHVPVRDNYVELLKKKQ